jgi:phosphoribosyl-dephospho-CoA transferase
MHVNALTPGAAQENGAAPFSNMNNDVFGDARESNAVLPHDLLWIPGVESLLSDGAIPDWVYKAMEQSSVVVVRRAPVVGDLIPIGVRGRSRSERFAASVASGCVRKRVMPEDLVAQRQWKGNPRNSAVPAMGAIEKVAQEWPLPEWVWGPTGSVGFELATGVHSATSESDLDLVVRADERLRREDAEILLKTVSQYGVTVDVQIETPLGSVSLRECVAPSSKWLLLKTCNGPKLVTDPWSDEEGELT